MPRIYFSLKFEFKTENLKIICSFNFSNNIVNLSIHLQDLKFEMFSIL